jgi:hypothetical protein
MYLLIALAHGLPVFIVALTFETKGVVLFSAALMIAFGVLTGNPAYAILDFVSVAVTTWMCFGIIDSRVKNSREASSKIYLFFSRMLKDLFQSVLKNLTY